MTADTPSHDPGQAPHHRRSREEVEALAKNFVGAATPDAVPPARPKALLMGGVAVAVVIAGAAAAFVLRSGSSATRQQSAATTRAAEQVEELRQRMEAERERTRKGLEAGSDYLDRMAAADARLVKDLSASADRLAAREAAAESDAPAMASSQGLPTPRDEPQRTASTSTATTPPTTTRLAPATAAPATTSGTAKTAAQPAPAKPQPAAAQPAQVAEAPKSSCKIHVSELSDSGTLTYEAIKNMKGARLDAASGHVFTPPVPAARGRTVVFEVMPDGCVKVARR